MSDRRLDLCAIRSEQSDKRSHPRWWSRVTGEVPPARIGGHRAMLRPRESGRPLWHAAQVATEGKTRDRGGGIHFVRRSDFRLRDIRLSFDATTGDLADSSMTPELRTDIFDEWLRIAERAASDSEAARDDAVAAPLEEGEVFTTAVLREFEASMIAVVASSFAIDAFFGSVIEHAPDSRVSANSRAATIYETLKNAFALSGAQAKAAWEPLRSIFEFRHNAVHPPAAWTQPILHPAFNVGMS